MSVFTNEDVITNIVLVDGSATVQPISGTVSVGNFPATQNVAVTSSVEVEVKNDSGSAIPVSGPLTDTQLRAIAVPVSGPLTDAQLRAIPVPISGTVTTTPSVSSSATTTQVTSTGANQTLLASNVNRKRLILFFNSGTWDVKLGATASATSRLLRVSSTNFYLELASYTGQVDAICTTSGKLVDVTELI